MIISHIGIDTTIYAPKDLSEMDKETWNWEFGYLNETQLPDSSFNIKKKWIEASCKHNIKALKNCLKYCVKVSKTFKKYDLKFYRMPIILPFFTCYWAQMIYKELLPELEDYLLDIGDYAKKHKIRLTMHAPMTVCLNSVKDNVIKNSVYTLKQLTKIYELLGYDTSKFHEYGIGITTHIGGREGGTDKYIETISSLDKNVINVLQVENDDKIYTVEDCLKIGLPVVLDIHHDWIVKGKYFVGNYSKILKTWKNVKPKIHASMPKKELIDWCFSDNTLITPNNKKFKVYADLPTVNELNKISKDKLRAHGDFIYGKSMKDLLLDYCDYADIMVEMRGCNLASEKLCRSFNKK